MTSAPIIARHFVNGEWRTPQTGPVLDVCNPVTGAALAWAPLSGSADVDEMVQAAQAAFPAWRRTPVADRVQPQYRFKPLLEDHWPTSPSAAGRRAS